MLGKEGSKDFVKKGMLLLSSISLYVLSFPSPGYYPLAWFCLVPLLGLLSNTSIKHAFLIGWIFGCLTNLIVAHWVFYATFRYSDISPWMSFLFPFLLLGVIFGLYFAIFAVGANYLLGSGLNKTIKMLGIASLWTVLEFCKAYLFSGLPWQLLGYSQYKATSIIQISDFTGVYGISFFIVLVNLLFYFLLIQKTNFFILLKRGSPIIIILLMLIGYGHLRTKKFSSVTAKNDRSLAVSVLQTNTPQHQKWNKKEHDSQVNDHLQATIPLLEEGADLVIWPETAVPYYLQRKIPLLLTELLEKHNAFLITGGQSFEKSNESYRYFNSAFQINKDGIRKTYNKMHLLPFAEYFPLSYIDFLRLDYAGEREYSAGKQFVVFDQNDLRYGVLICFESLYPKLARGFIRNKTDFLVNIANYAWFGHFGAQEQQFSHNVIRAVEFRRPIIVSSNTGVSGVIDASGKIVSQLPPFQKGSAKASLSQSSELTFYYYFGDLFVVVCLIYLLCLFVYFLWFGRAPASGHL